MKAAGRCVHYTKYKTNKRIFQYNDAIFGMYQASNPDGSFSGEFYYNNSAMEFEIHFE